MNACIIVKGVQFKHQIVYDGVDDQVHCIFCQHSWLTRREAEDAFLWDIQNDTTRWPEGSEL